MFVINKNLIVGCMQKNKCSIKKIIQKNNYFIFFEVIIIINVKL